MPEKPIDLEELIRWLRGAERAMQYGEVGIVLCKREGRVVLARRIQNETYKLDALDRKNNLM